MKKLIAICLALTVFVWTAGPILAGAQAGAIGITTGLTQDSSGGTVPRVLVSWVARGDSYTSPTQYYRDNSTAEYSQINPSGQEDVNTTIAMCAIVESDYGIDYINAVYADVYYPVDIELPTWHSVLLNQSGDGCGKFMQQDLLTKLTKQQGIDLFCTNVYGNNIDLPYWNSSESYTSLCGTTGKLYKDEAVVYCGKKTISYEDPAGFYKITTLVQDKNSGSGTHDHGFNYEAMTAFEVDFSEVQYGPVKLNINKIISGDVDFTTIAKPTIKNVGNTRLSISVYQDDMNLGKTTGVGWNVGYGARIGHVVGFTTYEPETTTPITSWLDLSEVNEMDFSVKVTKFPYPLPDGGFVGNMTLSANDPGFDLGACYTN